MLFQDPNVKVFISFDSVDSQLAYQLKGILEDGGISCYLFDVTPRCGLSLAEKIMNEIDTSHALVAIIMDRSSSAYSDTPKFVPRKLHQAENFVDHLIL